MPHLRLEVPEEWTSEDHTRRTGFDARKLLDHLVSVVTGLRMPDVANPSQTVSLINKSNLKHAIIPLRYAHMAGDSSKGFLHVTLSAGNDIPGRTAEVRFNAAETLGNEIDKYVADLGLSDIGSITVWVQDIDRSRGYSTMQERRKKRDAGRPPA